MGETTKVEWAQHTFNPWRGCEHATLADGSSHPGCTHCYAETMSGRNPGTLGRWGSEAEGGVRVMGSAAYWRQPLKWDREAAATGERCRVFCASLADVFEDWQGPIMSPGLNGGVAAIDDARSRLLTMDDLRARLFALIDVTPNLDWLLLTKRPENIRRMWPSYETDEFVGKRDFRPGVAGGLRMDNVWLLTSVSDQATADALIPELLACRDLAPVLGISAEPLLGPIDLRLHRFDEIAVDPLCDDCDERHDGRCEQLDWVIVGGESGYGARPFDVAWAREIRDQCQAADVPCFIKQLGSMPCDGGYQPAGGWWKDQRAEWRDVVHGEQKFGRRLKDKKGGNWDEWPDDLRVREFPHPTEPTQ